MSLLKIFGTDKYIVWTQFRVLKR